MSSLSGTTETHNTMADGVAPAQLIDFINLPQKDMLFHSFNPSAENIPGSVMKLAVLELVYTRGWEDGLMYVFTTKTQKVFLELLAQNGVGKSYSRTCGIL